MDILKLPQHLKFKKGQNSVEILPSLGINQWALLQLAFLGKRNPKF